MKERIEKAKQERKRIKLIFEYPNSKSVTVRRGIVKSVNPESFDFLEDKDGLVTYRYKNIMEIKNES